MKELEREIFKLLCKSKTNFKNPNHYTLKEQEKMTWDDAKAIATHIEKDYVPIACPNCKEDKMVCACMRNICIKCGMPVGNITFSVCDKCWDKGEPNGKT